MEIIFGEDERHFNDRSQQNTDAVLQRATDVFRVRRRAENDAGAERADANGWWQRGDERVRHAVVTRAIRRVHVEAHHADVHQHRRHAEAQEVRIAQQREIKETAEPGTGAGCSRRVGH